MMWSRLGLWRWGRCLAPCGRLSPESKRMTGSSSTASCTRDQSNGNPAMNFANFFIERPVFAGVLSIVTVIVGAIAIFTLPIAQYPQIAPPTVTVSATYPGANAKTVAETVAAPIEEQINGVEGMLYMSSQSSNDGNMKLTITFKLGTNLDIAQVQVQNRATIAQPQLPPEVVRAGIVVKKSSPSITLGMAIYSPD